MVYPKSYVSWFGTIAARWTLVNVVERYLTGEFPRKFPGGGRHIVMPLIPRKAFKVGIVQLGEYMALAEV
jgi:hypothetical protein